MEHLRTLLQKSKRRQKKTANNKSPLPTKAQSPKIKKQNKDNAASSNACKASNCKSKQKKVTILTSKPNWMTDEEFHAFIKRLKYYNLCYMNLKMYVGIDEGCIADDTKSVLANIRKAIRRSMFLKDVEITEDTIVEHSTYSSDQVKILKLETILEPIDEMKPMAMSA